MANSGYGTLYGSTYGDAAIPVATDPTVTPPPDYDLETDPHVTIYPPKLPIDPTQATPRNPFLYLYGSRQGRADDLDNFDPTDGTYSYVLGSDLQIPHNLRVGDYVEISQPLEFAAINLLRMDLKVLQPQVMPAQRDISSSATLQRGKVNSEAPAKLLAGNAAPYALADGQTLIIDIDGVTQPTITFVDDPAYFFSISNASAAEVATVIYAALNAGRAYEILQQVTPGAYAAHVVIQSPASGTTSPSSTVEVTGGTAAAALGFPAHNGRDDLSAIVAPNAAFTIADVGRPLVLSGTAAGAQDMTTRITGVVSPTVATLYDQIVAEVTGFSAILSGSLWEASIWIKDQKVRSILLGRGESEDTGDVAINVSKLTTLELLTFRLTLVQDP